MENTPLRSRMQFRMNFTSGVFSNNSRSVNMIKYIIQRIGGEY